MAPQIRDRVLSAARELNYQPDALGRSLVLGRTETIGMLVPDLANPSFQMLMRGLSRIAGQDGYRILFADSAEQAEEEAILAREMSRRCDGLVLTAPRMPREELDQLRQSVGPLVLYNRLGEGGVAIDYRAGVHQLCAHLHALGHRHLAFVAGPGASVSNRLRGVALQEFAHDHPEIVVDVVPGGVDWAAGARAADAVLDTGATGVLAFNDLVAMGLTSALGEREVSVPGQVSVAGFDDIPFAAYVSPPLTTCRTPAEEAARHCWRLLRAAMDHPGVQDDGVVLHPELVVRSSTGPVAGG